MSHHELKIEKQWLDRIRSHEKKAEVRRNDRDFQCGDTVRLHWAKDSNIEPAAVVSQSVFCTITHVLTDVPGVETGYAVLSLCIGGPDE